MTEVATLDGQSYIDVVMAEYGDITGLQYMLSDNGVAVDADPSAGEKLVIRDGVRSTSEYSTKKLVQVLDTYQILIEGGQSIWDVAIQAYGSIEAITLLASDNSLKKLADTPILAGDKLTIQVNPEIEDKATMRYFAKKRLKVNTGDTASSAGERGGIGYMRIGGNFKVS